MLSESLVGNTVLYLEQLLGSGRMLSAVANSPLAGIAATCGSVQLRQTDLVKTTDDKLSLEHVAYKAIGASNSTGYSPVLMRFAPRRRTVRSPAMRPTSAADCISSQERAESYQ